MTTKEFLKKIRQILKWRRQQRAYNRVSLLTGAAVLFVVAVQAQSGRNLALADQYFNAGEYLTAASLYDQYLNPVEKQKPTSDFTLNFKKTRNESTAGYGGKFDIVYKQAESYRLGNEWSKASALYQQCYETDAVKFAAAAYWHAVCQRNLGNFAAAEASLQKFFTGDVSASPYKQLAEKEKAILAFIRAEMSSRDSVLYTVRKIESSLTDKGVFAATSAASGQYIITSTVKDSVTVPGVNPNHNRLFYATVVKDRIEAIQPVSFQTVDDAINQGAASINPSGNRIYLTQWKREDGKLVSEIYTATKSRNGWGRPVLLHSVNLKGFNSKQPFCSADGKYLFFASDRKGGMGNFDIWYAPVKTDGTTGAAVNAGASVNTSGDEVAPFYQVSGETLVFSSDRAPGMGGYDLYMSKGVESKWSQPVNLGYPVNSSRDDMYFFSAENSGLLDLAYFSSDRGSECCLATYAVSKAEKKKTITGFIRDCADNNPVENAEVVLKDASGKEISTITGTDGKYTFSFRGSAPEHDIIVNKESYTKKISPVIVSSTDATSGLEEIFHTETLCIEMEEIIKVENVVSIYFEFDRFELKPDAIEILDSVYNVLATETGLQIQISGYTDGKGSAAYNKKLSDKRAKACADYLIKKGLDATRINFESFGDCCPIEMELINGRDNPDGRGLNRRAMINIARD